MQKDSSRAIGRYDSVAIALHDVMVIALVLIFAGGLYMADLPFSPMRLKYFSWHKWAGCSVLALAFVRLAWRITHRPPALPAAISSVMPAWQRVAHHGTHVALYLLFFAVPLVGWAYSSAAGFPVVIFGKLALPDLVAADPALATMLKPLHKGVAYAMAVLVVLHVMAGLKHHFIDRDGLLSRMAIRHP